jgi:uncharacterized membrane protein YidH (DUF202 family)
VILVPAALLAGVAAVAVRFARSSGEERLQLKWFVTAAALVVAAFVPLALAPQIGLSPAVAAAAVSALKVAFSLALVCLYAAIAVAVLKYRLYDIDRVISRTLAYAIVDLEQVGAAIGVGGVVGAHQGADGAAGELERDSERRVRSLRLVRHLRHDGCDRPAYVCAGTWRSTGPGCPSRRSR